MSVPNDLRLFMGSEKGPISPSGRPRPLDLPSPVVAGVSSYRGGDGDGHGSVMAQQLLPGIIRRRLLSPFSLIVMVVSLLLLGWWSYSDGFGDRIPVQTERVVSYVLYTFLHNIYGSPPFPS
jgi:hypothetical protein